MYSYDEDSRTGKKGSEKSTFLENYLLSCFRMISISISILSPFR